MALVRYIRCCSSPSGRPLVFTHPSSLWRLRAFFPLTPTSFPCLCNCSPPSTALCRGTAQPTDRFAHTLTFVPPNRTSLGDGLFVSAGPQRSFGCELQQTRGLPALL